MLRTDVATGGRAVVRDERKREKRRVHGAEVASAGDYREGGKSENSRVSVDSS